MHCLSYTAVYATQITIDESKALSLSLALTHIQTHENMNEERKNNLGNKCTEPRNVIEKEMEINIVISMFCLTHKL